MTIDWTLVARIAGPVVGVVAGFLINRRFESRPNLIAHFGHVAAFQVTPDNGPAFGVHTHAVVLRNSGRRPATNVRLRHNFLPNFRIDPTVTHHIEELPDGVKDIVVPRLIPDEVITVSYLYYPPLTVAQINAGIRSDEGFAHPIPVLLQRQYPKWVSLTLGGLVLIGFVTVGYVVFYVIGRALHWA